MANDLRMGIETGYFLRWFSKQLLVYKCSDGINGSINEAVAVLYPMQWFTKNLSEVGDLILEAALEDLKPNNLVMGMFTEPNDYLTNCSRVVVVKTK